MRPALLTRLVALVIAAASIAIPCASAQAAPSVTGAGSSWVQIALDQWRADAARFGLEINYQGVGSSAGRQFYIIGQVDFAATEIPFVQSEIDQLDGAHKTFQYIPDVAGGTALMYNVTDASGKQVDNLRLSARTIAKIYAGKITTWNDPDLRAENPGLRLPSTHITPIIRSDGSGTSAKLADYLAHEAGDIWNPFAAENHITMPLQFWPNFHGAVAVRGSDGVANFVSNPSVGKGAIGYVEAGYAYEHSLTPAYVKNRSGNYAAPSSMNVSIALKHATLNRDLTQNLAGVYAAPEKTAYPLASYSYLVTPTAGLDPAKGAVLGKWILYIACEGQQSAAPLGYSPLPPNLVQAVFDAVKRIPGAPAPPPLDKQHCKNPTITGEGQGGGYGGGPQSSPEQATSGPAAPASGSGSGGVAAAGSAGSGDAAAGGAGADGEAAGGDVSASQLAATALAGGAGTAGLSVDPMSADERAESFDHALAAVRGRSLEGPAPIALLVLVLGVLGGPFLPGAWRTLRTRNAAAVAAPPPRPPAARAHEGMQDA